jgi:hypothetical protein
MSLNMLIETPAADYTAAECAEWMRLAASRQRAQST